MKKLLIIVYKINVDGKTRSQIEQDFITLINSYSLREDEELKENYIIREIWLPIKDMVSDVQIIYPIPNYISPELNKLVNEISNKIKEDPTNNLKQQWEKLVRELKLRKINNE